VESVPGRLNICLLQNVKMNGNQWPRDGRHLAQCTKVGSGGGAGNTSTSGEMSATGKSCISQRGSCLHTVGYPSFFLSAKCQNDAPSLRAGRHFPRLVNTVVSSFREYAGLLNHAARDISMAPSLFSAPQKFNL